MKERRELAVASLLVAALAVLIYAPTLSYGFLEYDDPNFILAPEAVRAPTLRTIGAVLTGPVWGSYHPLHILSYSLDSAVWGMERPQGFHATNVALFALCAALVVRVAHSFGCSARGAALAGVVFAVHPSHVESVAWLTGRKDVLSGAFVLLALLYRGRPKLAFGLFLLALASKTTAAAYAPFLVAAEWLRPAMRSDRDIPFAPRTGRARSDERTFVRHVPFLALAVAWVVIEALCQREVGGVKPLRGGSFLEQARIVIESLAWYPIRFVYPHPLTHRPSLDLRLVAALGVLAPIVVAAFASRRAALAAAFFFLALAPVSNVVPLANEVQDRYLFLPSIAAACVVGELLARRRAFVLAALAVGLLAHETARYTQCWRSDELLWKEAVRVDPEAPIPRIGLAGVLLEQGRFDEAEKEARKATEKGGPLAWIAVARAAEKKGDLASARSALERAWELSNDPENGAALVRLLARTGDLERGRAVLEQLEERAKEGSGTHRARAYVLQASRDLVGAETEYLAASRDLGADDWLTLAALERALGRDDRARASLGRALELDTKLRARIEGDPVLGPLLRGP